MTGKFGLQWLNKGSAQDIFFIVGLVLTLAIVGILAVKFVTIMNTQIQAKAEFPAVAKETMSTVTTRLPTWIDGAFLFVYVFLLIIALILAMSVDTNPVMLPISVIYMIFLVIISRMVGVLWDRISTSATLATEAALFPIINFMMPKLHIFSFVVGVGILILMVIKRQSA